ncbi:hypothetical protein [Rhodococcus erythropolis]|uniref:hypothetical protein n=1 Tax=Rhodococcus erythropolis TaxID=1833 RepID=UPI001BE73C03|nr:hypothetical protein [Rhodococcus erythropolis]MBT2269836.1 hypothetical protein [Rhodococcus erythropolis]
MKSVIAAIGCLFILTACSPNTESVNDSAPEVTWNSLQEQYLPKLQNNTASKLICGFQSGVATCLDRVKTDLNSLDSAATTTFGNEAAGLSSAVNKFNSAHALYVKGRCGTAGGTLTCSTNLLEAENAAIDARNILKGK